MSPRVPTYFQYHLTPLVKIKHKFRQIYKNSEFTFSQLNARIYREPKKRAMWLRIWFDSLEEVEGSDPWALAFNEEEEK